MDTDEGQGAAGTGWAAAVLGRRAAREDLSVPAILLLAACCFFLLADLRFAESARQVVLCGLMFLTGLFGTWLLPLAPWIVFPLLAERWLSLRARARLAVGLLGLALLSSAFLEPMVFAAVKRCTEETGTGLYPHDDQTWTLPVKVWVLVTGNTPTGLPLGPALRMDLLGSVTSLLVGMATLGALLSLLLRRGSISVPWWATALLAPLLHAGRSWIGMQLSDERRAPFLILFIHVLPYAAAAWLGHGLVTRFGGGEGGPTPARPRRTAWRRGGCASSWTWPYRCSSSWRCSSQASCVRPSPPPSPWASEPRPSW